MSLVVVEHFGKSYQVRGGEESVWAVQDFSLTIAPGEFVTLVGPSGCGKSTVLNAIAGFVSADEGSVEVNGAPVRGPGIDRSVVFQAASLLPWRSVVRNVSYGMELQRTKTKSERADRAQWAIDLVGLSQFRNHYPSQLSGGMQQRVNLARALATEPQVLLMDEPFGALDAMTKERMQEQLIEITQRTGQAVVFITHDISEAIYLADRVVVMGARPGHVKAIHDVEFDRPRSAGITETEDFQMLRHEIREQLEAEIGAAAA